jgi:peptidoglycan/LPS O-acetylase OafA/YrhL
MNVDTHGPIADVLPAPGPPPLVGTEPSPPLRRHIPALDGIRAIAVMAVLANHYTVLFEIDKTGPPGDLIQWIADRGVYGVDLFFALSGFLITGILLDSKGDRRYFSTFYARRMLRIFPLYYAYLFVVFVVVRLSIHHRRGEDILPFANPWLYVAYLSNWSAGTGSMDKLLGHMWSLAVEEQFYLVWPLVVSVLSARWLARACVATAVTALAIRCLLAWLGFDGETIYRSTPTRMDCLTSGALFALAIRDESWRILIRRLSPVAWASLGAGIALVAWYGHGFYRLDPLVMTVGYSLSAAASGLFIYSMAVPGGRLAGLLELGPLRRWADIATGSTSCTTCPCSPIIGSWPPGSTREARRRSGPSDTRSWSSSPWRSLRMRWRSSAFGSGSRLSSA